VGYKLHLYPYKRRAFFNGEYDEHRSSWTLINGAVVASYAYKRRATVTLLSVIACRHRAE
jgi:hypothetical protein